MSSHHRIITRAVDLVSEGYDPEAAWVMAAELATCEAQACLAYKVFTAMVARARR